MADDVSPVRSVWPPLMSSAALISPIAHDRIRSEAWMAAAIIADMSGAIILAISIFESYSEPSRYPGMAFWAGVTGFAVIWCLASRSQKLYDNGTIFSSLRKVLLSVIVSWALTFGLILLLSLSFHNVDDICRPWLLTWAASVLVWLISVRIYCCRQLDQEFRRGHCVDRALILSGCPIAGQRAADALERESRGQIRAVAVNLIPGMPNAPACEEIEAAIRDSLVDHVFIVSYDGLPSEANALLARLANLAVDATLLPDLQTLRMPIVRAAQIGRLFAVDVAARPLPSCQALLKRAEDLLLASIFLLLFSPLMLLIAIAIKLDSPGPVFFRQLRLGFHDKPFLLWKFRTMYQAQPGNGPLVQTARNDPRITRIGGFLRRTSLDELPQFFNVIRGEMSVVGPRPHATTMTTAGRPLEAVLVGYASRHRVKPGITGWAQVNNCRGEVNTEAKLRDRVALDCYYIEHWSMVLDLKIIIRTAVFLIFDRNAY